MEGEKAVHAAVGVYRRHLKQYHAGIGSLKQLRVTCAVFQQAERSAIAFGRYQGRKQAKEVHDPLDSLSSDTLSTALSESESESGNFSGGKSVPQSVAPLAEQWNSRDQVSGSEVRTAAVLGSPARTMRANTRRRFQRRFDKKKGVEGAGLATTTFNVLCLVIACSELGLPYALQSTGFSGLIMLTVVVLTAMWTALAVGRVAAVAGALSWSAGAPTADAGNTFPEIGYLLWGSTGRLAVQAMLGFDMLSASSFLLLFSASNLRHAVPSIFGSDSEPSRVFQSIAIVAVLLLPIVFLSVKKMSIFSAVGLVSQLIVVVIVLAHGDIPEGSVSPTLPTDFFHPKLWPVGFSILSTACGGHPALLPMRGAMRHPDKHFRSAIIVSFLVASVWFAIVSGVGYQRFGSLVPQNAMTALPHDAISLAAIVGISVKAMATYSLCLAPVKMLVLSMHATLKVKWVSVVATVLLVVTTMLMAWALPKLAFVLAFKGATIVMVDSYILPCWIDLRLNGGLLNFRQKVLHVLVIAGGVIAGTLGIIATASIVATGATA